MRKFILSISVTFLFVAYIIFERNNMAQTPLYYSPTATVGNSTTTGSSPARNPSPTSTASQPTPKPKPSPTPTPAPTPAPTIGQYKDGQYTGSNADAFYGNVLVKAVISGGKLVDVQFLDYPRDRRQSEEISAMSMPRLIQEAIVAQSAKVDIVSGATDTSNAFRQSLTSALAQAIN